MDEAIIEAIVEMVRVRYEISEPLERHGQRSPWDGEPEEVLAKLLWRTGISKAEVARRIDRSPSGDAARNANRVSGYDHEVAALTRIAALELGGRLGRCSSCGNSYIAPGQRGNVGRTCVPCRREKIKADSAARYRAEKEQLRDRKREIRPSRAKKGFVKRQPVRIPRGRPSQLAEVVTVCGCGGDYMLQPIDHRCAHPQAIRVKPATVRELHRPGGQ